MGTTCPICSKECDTPGHARRHLHVDHRKSELLEALLEVESTQTKQREPVAVLG